MNYSINSSTMNQSISTCECIDITSNCNLVLYSACLYICVIYYCKF